MRTLYVGLVFVLATITLATAQEESVPAATSVETIRVGEGLVMELPRQWMKKEPRSRIVEHECFVPAVEGDDTGGRVIMMHAGGSVTANLDRWIGQFAQPDGGDSKEQARLAQQEVAGQQVHTIDVRGTYKDRPRGPSGPSVDRPNYRMLGAVIVSTEGDSYFVKLYGPEKTVAANEDIFHAMLDGLRKSDVEGDQPAE